jgi:hypothetical protein
MQCPYCTSSVDEAALACPYCTRDLHLVKHLLERIEALEQRLEEAGVRDSEELYGDESADTHTEIVDDWQTPPTRYFHSLLPTLLAALVLLVAAHGVLLFLFDVNPLYLRLTSMLIPVPFGFALFRRAPGRLRLSALAGFGMACGAVWGMLMVTALIDHVPVLPQDTREAREVLEYSASIGLAFLTGLLLSLAVHRQKGGRHNAGLVVRLIALLFAKDVKGQSGIERIHKQVQPILNILTPIVTALASLYTGIKVLFGVH